jgi:plasmid stability protein
MRNTRQMAQLTIRDVPEDVVNDLHDQAAELHTSLNAVARAALLEHVELRRKQRRLATLLPSLEELHRAILEDRGNAPLPSDSTEFIREDRHR